MGRGPSNLARYGALSASRESIDAPTDVMVELETEAILTEETIVVIPLGAAAKEHGPRCFYVLNTGISTIEPLKAVAEAVDRDGMVLHYTNIARI